MSKKENHPKSGHGGADADLVKPLASLPPADVVVAVGAPMELKRGDFVQLGVHPQNLVVFEWEADRARPARANV